MISRKIALAVCAVLLLAIPATAQLISGSGGNGGGTGTVTSVGQSFTGGLVSVSGSPITTSGTLALTVAGTSGGIPYFSSASTWASSGALTANAIVLGGGAGSAPTPLGSLGTTTTVLHGNASGAPTFGAVVLTTDVSGILPSANGGAGSVSGIMQANGSGLTAAATLGNGLSYSSPKLSLTNTLNAQTGTSYAVASTDAASIITGKNASAMGFTIVQANTAGFTSGYGTTLANINAPGGTNLTLTATTSVFGNNQTSIVLAPGQVADIGSDGTNYPFSAVSLPVMAADTVLGNYSGTANYPIAGTLTDCHAVTNGVSYSTTTHTWGCNTSLALTNAANSFTGEQRNGITTLSISTATFTPDNSNNNYKIVLVHASCPCTIANPTTVTAGAAGVIEVDQSATGSDTVGTWGSDYIAAGGVAALTLSSGANAKDFFSYIVLDSTHILVTPGALNATH